MNKEEREELRDLLMIKATAKGSISLTLINNIDSRITELVNGIITVPKEIPSVPSMDSFASPIGFAIKPITFAIENESSKKYPVPFGIPESAQKMYFKELEFFNIPYTFYAFKTGSRVWLGNTLDTINSDEDWVVMPIMMSKSDMFKYLNNHPNKIKEKSSRSNDASVKMGFTGEDCPTDIILMDSIDFASWWWATEWLKMLPRECLLIKQNRVQIFEDAVLSARMAMRSLRK